MKKFGYIILLFIFLLQTGGMLLIYQVLQCQAYHDISLKLTDPGTQFQKITISMSEYLENKIGSRELRINGKLYDIKSKKTTNNTVELMLIDDANEDEIWDEIKSFLDQFEGQGNNFPQQLCQLLLMNYTVPQAEDFFYISTGKTISFPEITILKTSLSLAIATPPPKLTQHI